LLTRFASDVVSLLETQAEVNKFL
jgi:Cu/Zn superoxide dismutase